MTTCKNCKHCGVQIQQGEYCQSEACVRARQRARWHVMHPPKDDVMRAKKAFATVRFTELGMRAVINAAAQRFQHSPEDLAARRAYIREANDRAAMIERSHLI